METIEENRHQVTGLKDKLIQILESSLKKSKARSLLPLKMNALRISDFSTLIIFVYQQKDN
jgi:hypothetical protein